MDGAEANVFLVREGVGLRVGDFHAGWHGGDFLAELRLVFLWHFGAGAGRGDGGAVLVDNAVRRERSVCVGGTTGKYLERRVNRDFKVSTLVGVVGVLLAEAHNNLIEC